MVNHTNCIIVLCLIFSNVMCEYLDLREGKKCLFKGINGTCASIYKCPKAKQDLMDKEYPPVCSYEDKEPIVCCTSCYIYTDSDLRDEVFNPHLGTIRKTNSLARNKFNEYLDTLDYPCKLHRRSSIQFRLDEKQNCYFTTESSSGYTYDEKLYPRPSNIVHTVLLGYGAELKSAQWLCSGSIISENFILTSANCTSSPELGPVRHVVAGMLNDTLSPDAWRHYGVKRIISHPEYRPDSKYHDIALIETNTQISFDYQVVPISTVATNDFWWFAVAWRELGKKKGLKDTLDSVTVATLANSDDLSCSILYPPQPLLANGFNDTIQNCYLFKKKSLDTCQDGDNGASVFTKDSTTCSFALLGVTAMSRSCGQNGGSALYTKVSYYLPWIESVVWPGETVMKYGNK